MHIPDAGRSKEVAQKVDELFANSPAETRTETEVAFQLAFVSMAGEVMKAIQVVSFVMMIILMLILGNTMAMSTRERTNEYAVMRSLGFQPRHILRLVLAEGLVVACIGLALGAAIAVPAFSAFAKAGTSSFGTFLATFGVSRGSFALAAAAAIIGGLVATGVPAVRASRLVIVDALRRVE
jgi:putative ABC transport system permease protein